MRSSPPLGGALIGIFGPVTTVIADAVSYLLSALGVGAIAGKEPRPAPVEPSGARRADLLAVLMLGQLHLAPWQYGLAFAAPCAGGLVGARLARHLSARYGLHKVLRRAGALRACWSVGLAFIPGGWAGIGVVAALQLAIITSCAVYNPIAATYRLEQTPNDRLARTLAAWTITTKVTVATVTAIFGVLASVVGVREAIAAAGILLLATPLLLPRANELEEAAHDVPNAALATVP